jgi:hypothetical protein
MSGGTSPHSGTCHAPTGKLTIRCTAWRQLRKNSLRGFATIQIVELRMTMNEVGVHQRNGKSWAQPPSRPWISKEGQLIRGDDGKIRYAPLFEFDSAEVRAAFSAAVIRAVTAFDPHALESGAAT